MLETEQSKMKSEVTRGGGGAHTWAEAKERGQEGHFEGLVIGWLGGGTLNLSYRVNGDTAPLATGSYLQTDS